MTIIIKTAGVSYAADNVGWFGEHLPHFGGALEWAGAFGSAWESPVGVYDYSMRGRPGQVVGSPVLSAGSAQVSVGNYFEAPITDSGLMAAGTANAFTLVAVVTGAPASGTASILSTLGTSVQSGFRFGKASGAGSLTLLADKGSETQSSISGPSGLSAAGAEFVAATVNGLSVTIYRRGALDSSIASATGTLTLTGIEGRNVAWRIGDSYAGTPPAISVSLAGLYNTALNGTQIGAVYDRAKARMAQRGIAI